MTSTRSALLTTLLATTVGFAAVSPLATEVAQAQNRLSRPTAPVPQPAPPADRDVRRHWPEWHRGRTLRQNDDWVETTFSVEEEGNKLLLVVQGSVEIQSAEVQFANGQTQPIPVRSQSYGNGEFLLLNFGSTQSVQSISLTGRSSLPKSQYSVQLWK